MFRILCDPSPGSTELCLTEITRSDSQIFCRTHTHTNTHIPQVQNYAAKHRPSTRQNTCEPLRVIPFKNSSVLTDDGSRKVRNMS